MDAGTKVTGYVNTSGLKRRTSPGGAIAATSLPQGMKIEGSIEKDVSGGDWVKLSKVGTETITTPQYCAAWFCVLSPVEITPPTPPQPKPITVTADVTTSNQVIVTVNEPNGYPVKVIVNGVEFIAQG